MPIGGAPFTAREMQVIPGLRAAGFTWDMVAQAMGRRSGKAVRLRWEKELDRDPAVLHTTTRACMTCRQPFPSPHCGVRMCDGCRKADTSPYESDY